MYVHVYANECVLLCVPMGRYGAAHLSGKYKYPVITAEEHVISTDNIRALGILVILEE